MNTTASLNSILQSLNYLSGNSKRWLATNLMEQADKEESTSTNTAKFDEITKKLWQLPMDESVSTEDIKANIRKSRLRGIREISPLSNYDTRKQ